MIEMYAFVAAFTLQIAAMSVLQPAWFIKYWRAQTTSIPAERLAQLYPDADPMVTRERFLSRYRALNVGIAVLGLVVLGGLFNYMQRPDWSDGPVEALVAVYFAVQAVPLALSGWRLVQFNQRLQRLAEQGKRKAVLERRGLLDFVSPFTVTIAVLSYLLFVGFVIYIRGNPFPGFAGALVNIATITLVYALNAVVVYGMLYGKKPNPFQTHASRVHMIGAAVRSSVYSCIACVVFLSLNFTLVLLDLQRWEPFGLSVFLVVSALLCLMGLAAPPRQRGADGPQGRLSPET